MNKWVEEDEPTEATGKEWPEHKERTQERTVSLSQGKRVFQEGRHNQLGQMLLLGENQTSYPKGREDLG